jgi:hypothetical protein
MNDVRQKITENIKHKSEFILRKIWPTIKDRRADFFIGGGCLSGTISDVDLFPVVGFPFEVPKDAVVISKSRNAVTLKSDPWPIQLCYYPHDNLESLVKSFDYAHIQVGVRVSVPVIGKMDIPFPDITEVYFTDDYIVSHVGSTTWFCGSEYPLSSMVRAHKYAQRGLMNRGAYVRSMISAMMAVMKRGFADYQDFLEQLDAVDLSLTPEEFAEVEKADLIQLFDMLSKEK